MKLLLPFIRSYGEIKRLARENAALAKPLNPTIDFVFKNLFSGKDEDSREALMLLAFKGLLSCCIHRPVRDLRLRNTEILPAFLLGKMFREAFGLLGRACHLQRRRAGRYRYCQRLPYAAEIAVVLFFRLNF